jgi:hypothetical protein
MKSKAIKNGAINTAQNEFSNIRPVKELTMDFQKDNEFNDNLKNNKRKPSHLPLVVPSNEYKKAMKNGAINTAQNEFSDIHFVKDKNLIKDDILDDSTKLENYIDRLVNQGMIPEAKFFNDFYEVKRDEVKPREMTRQVEKLKETVANKKLREELLLKKPEEKELREKLLERGLKIKSTFIPETNKPTFLPSVESRKEKEHRYSEMKRMIEERNKRQNKKEQSEFLEKINRQNRNEQIYKQLDKQLTENKKEQAELFRQMNEKQPPSYDEKESGVPILGNPNYRVPKHPEEKESKIEILNPEQINEWIQKSGNKYSEDDKKSNLVSLRTIPNANDLVEGFNYRNRAKLATSLGIKTSGKTSETIKQEILGKLSFKTSGKGRVISKKELKKILSSKRLTNAQKAIRNVISGVCNLQRIKKIKKASRNSYE